MLKLPEFQSLQNKLLDNHLSSVSSKMNFKVIRIFKNVCYLLPSTVDFLKGTFSYQKSLRKLYWAHSKLVTLPKVLLKKVVLLKNNFVQKSSQTDYKFIDTC